MAEDYYLTPYETALAVVATAMKKLRLRLDQLMLNSFMGGLLFTTGGMLHVMAQAESPGLLALNPVITHLIQGLLYPIGLFYVAVLGMELFNANVLFFSAALCRGAVSILDVATSWLVSWWLNLVGNIFVCYIICNYSGISREELYIRGLIEIVMAKVEFSFVETMLKGCAGNFFVALAIYLQLMCKPLHVRLIMMALPVFSFVSMGFTHVVADMFMMIIGLINGAPVSVATVAWKIFLPGTIGNIIGGLFFGVVITWYCHIYAVERDQAQLNLPKYDMRDEQPDVNVDSRVVRQRRSSDFVEEDSSDTRLEKPTNVDNIVRSSTQLSRYTTGRSLRLLRLVRSPKNVFPVYGMGQPLHREQSIASRRTDDASVGNDRNSAYSAGLCNWSEEDNDSREAPGAEFIGDRLRRAMTRVPLGRDLESHGDLLRRQSSASIWRRSPGSKLSLTQVRSSSAVGPRDTDTDGNNDIMTKEEHGAPTGITTSTEGPKQSNSLGTATPYESSIEVKAYQPETDLGER